MVPEHKKRFWVTMDKGLIDRLDAMARDQGAWRSTIITRAVEAHLDRAAARAAKKAAARIAGNAQTEMDL